MQAPAQLVRASSFIIGAALAVLVAVQLGILEPRVPVRAPVAPTTPVVVPLSSSASSEQAPASAVDADVRARARSDRRPAKPGVRTTGRSTESDRPTSTSNENRSDPNRGSSKDRPRDGGAGADIATESSANRSSPMPVSFNLARTAVQRLTNARPRSPSAAELNEAAGRIELAARELGRREVVDCIDQFYRDVQQLQNRLLGCWRQLEAEIDRRGDR